MAGAAGVARHPRLLAGVVAVALLSSVMPYALELVALRSLSTRVFGVLMSLQPAAAAIAGFVILNQHLGPTPIAALILVSAAGIGITRPPAPHRPAGPQSGSAEVHPSPGCTSGLPLRVPPSARQAKVVAQSGIRHPDGPLGYHSGSRPAPRNPKW